MGFLKRATGIIFSLLLLILVPCHSYATPVYMENGKIYGHKSPEGTISFFIKDSSYNNWKALFTKSRNFKEWEFQIHKVFPDSNKQYYFLYAELNGKNLIQNPVTGITLILDKKSYPLEHIEDVNPIIQDNLFRGWYNLSDEAIAQLESANEISLNFSFAAQADKVVRPFSSIAAAFKNLSRLSKTQYVREGQVLEPSADITKEFYYPQLYIPHTTPEEAMAAFIYDTNFTQSKKGEDEFNYSYGYQVRYTADPQVVQLESNTPYDNDYSFVTAAFRPYKDGVWVTVNLQRKNYQYGSVSYYPFSASTSGIFASRSFWRAEDNLWAMRLLSVQRQLYGSYSYGLTWKEAKTGTGPFEIRSVNVAQFPELMNVHEKDMITAVNGIPTKFMLPLDMDYLLTTSVRPVEFTITSASGVESVFSITPQLNKSEGMKKNYKDLITKIPRRFVKVDKNAPLGNSYLDSDIFDPLGSGVK